MEIHYLGDHPEVIPVLASWIYDEWSYLYPGMALQNVVDFLMERTHQDRLPLAFVAFEAGEPVGTVSLKEFDMETRNDLTTWVTSLYVAKAWRRRRIGSRLLQAVEQKAAELNICKLYLFVTDMALATLFYSQFGWSVKEETIYHSCPVIIMEREMC